MPPSGSVAQIRSAQRSNQPQGIKSVLFSSGTRRTNAGGPLRSRSRRTRCATALMVSLSNHATPLIENGRPADPADPARLEAKIPFSTPPRRSIPWFRADSGRSRAPYRTAEVDPSRPLSLRAGNGSSCPTADLAGRIKKPARMCREPIFSSPATKIPLLDLDRVKGMGQSRQTTLRRQFSAQAQ